MGCRPRITRLHEDLFEAVNRLPKTAQIGSLARPHAPFGCEPSFLSPLPFIFHELQIFTSAAHFLVQTTDNDETANDGDAAASQDDGRCQHHHLRRWSQMRELVALRREGGRRGGKSSFLFCVAVGAARTSPLSIICLLMRPLPIESTCVELLL